MARGDWKNVLQGEQVEQLRCSQFTVVLVGDGDNYCGPGGIDTVGVYPMTFSDQRLELAGVQNVSVVLHQY